MGAKLVKEITSGASATLALDAAGGSGSSSLRFQRVWKIVYDNSSDIVNDDVRPRIGTTVGQLHPLNPFCVCDSIDVKPDGDSRHVYIVTATYSSQALSLETGGYETGAGGNADPRSQPLKQERPTGAPKPARSKRLVGCGGRSGLHKRRILVCGVWQSIQPAICTTA